MANGVAISIEGGILKISAQIPMVNAGEEIEMFVRELRFQLFGSMDGGSVSLSNPASRDLNEKDAAKYIGRSVSFLRDCRYKIKNGIQCNGPKYTRDSARRIRYPVMELNRYLERRDKKLFNSTLDEKAAAIKGM
ncbi:MAG: hypothetical protein LBS93_07410 [Synergistaceae bacterium]|jgi:hypothetical protein|nr:hypothetical protein [Synergistaceae bacterium]